MERAKRWLLVGVAASAIGVAVLSLGASRGALGADRASAGAVRAVGANAAATDPILCALPERPLMVCEVESPLAFAEAVRQTRLGEHMKDSPALAALLDVGRDLARLGAAIYTDLSDATLERLAGRQAALVGFRPSGPSGGKPPVALAVYLGGDAKLVKDAFEQQTLPRLKASNPQLSVGQEQVGGGPVTVFNKGAKETYVRFVGDLLVLGTKDAVTRFRPAASPPEWLRGPADPGGVATARLDLEPLWAQAMSDMAQRPGDRQGLETTGLVAVRNIAGATVSDDGGFKDTLVARLRPESSGLLPGIMALKSGEARCGAVVPDEYAFVASCQIESGEKLYALIEDVARQSGGEAGLQQFRAGMDQVDQAFAVNLEWELLPRIGSEAFFAVRAPGADVVASGRKPGEADFLPIFGFAVKDEPGLRDLFKRFAASQQVAQMGWQLITEGHEGKEVLTLNNIAAPARLSFAFLEGFLVCSRETEAVRSVISAVAGGRTLAKEAQYQTVRAHLPAQANAYAYADTRAFRPLVLEALRRGAPPKAQPFLPLIERTVPDLGGYGLVLLAEGSDVRAEGYGDAPAALTFLSLASIGAVESQAKAAQHAVGAPGM